MATLSKGVTFGSTETVTNTKLHNLVDLGGVSGIVDADIDASAAISESKIAAITSAGKVNGSALTGLANIPSGAGTIPSANLGVGTNVQAYDADLAAIAALAKADSNFIVGNGTTWVVETGATARTSLGLGALATKAQADLTTDVTGTLPTGNGGTGATANANVANGVVILDGSGYVPNVSVDTTALKTATGEVSVAASDNVSLTLPGGGYGFYPQLKMSTASADTRHAYMHYRNNVAGWTSYVTHIDLASFTYTLYAQQRYVTASGRDYWIWLLVDKTSKEILAATSAPDHPSYRSEEHTSELQSH